MRGHTVQRGQTWTYWVDVGRDESGKRKQLTKGGFKTKREAQVSLNQVLSKLDEGSYSEPTKQTVAAFMREWLVSIKVSVRPSTWATYQTFVEKHIIPILGTTQLQRLTVAQLNGFYAHLLENGRRDGKGGLSPRTVFYAHATIRKALSEAVRWQLLARNVADQASPPRHGRTQELDTWSAHELKRFLEHVATDRLFAAYYLAAYSGLRRGELLGLRWRDADLERGALSIVQTLITVDYKVSFSTPKTAAGKRSVVLDSGTVGILETHRQHQAEERARIGLPSPSVDDIIFSELDGSPIHPNGFSDRFNRVVKAAGVPRVRLHDLRHTHATLMLTAGVHPKVVQERLGHSNIAVTLQTYSHVLPAMQEEAAAKFANLVLQSSR